MSGENPITVCQSCNEPLEPDFAVCPNCGKERALSCPNCQKPIKSKWKVCPRCRTSLPGWATPTQGASSTNGGLAGNCITSPFVSGAQSNNEVLLVEGDELLRRFIIKTKLGTGGFGTVYHAHDHERGGDVALKVVAADSGQAQAAAEQLRQELRLRDSINDFTHIIRTYDIHTVNYKGLSFVLLPMEYADGGSLRSWMNEHKHNKEHRISEGLELFKHACLGVKAIHDAGLAHLDIKPENLLLCKNGDTLIVKVSDFGISRNIEHFSMNVSAATQAGLGSPYYMSPEQVRVARQKDVGPQADVYSLGVFLFEILDGDPPFDGSVMEVKQKHLDTEPPRLKGINGTLTSVVYKCLAKTVSERLRNVANLLEALGANAGLAGEIIIDAEHAKVLGEDIGKSTQIVKSNKDKKWFWLDKEFAENMINRSAKNKVFCQGKIIKLENASELVTSGVVDKWWCQDGELFPLITMEGLFVSGRFEEFFPHLSSKPEDYEHNYYLYVFMNEGKTKKALYEIEKAFDINRFIEPLLLLISGFQDMDRAHSYLVSEIEDEDTDPELLTIAAKIWKIFFNDENQARNCITRAEKQAQGDDSEILLWCAKASRVVFEDGRQARHYLLKGQDIADSYDLLEFAEAWLKFFNDEHEFRRCVKKAKKKADEKSYYYCTLAETWRKCFDDHEHVLQYLRKAEDLAKKPGDWDSCAKAWRKLFNDISASKRCKAKAETVRNAMKRADGLI